jgi:hypothetical protein
MITDRLPCAACGRRTSIDELRRSDRETLYCQSCLEEEASFYRPPAWLVSGQLLLIPQ